MKLALRLFGTAVVFGIALFLVWFVLALAPPEAFTARIWHVTIVVALVPAALTAVWVAGRWLIRERGRERHDLWTGLSLIGAVTMAGVAGLSWLYSYGGESPVNASPPPISGKVQVGEMLTADPGRWRPAERLDFGYQWERCRKFCEEIVGATSRNYLLRPRDSGARLRVHVVATRKWSEAAFSARSPRAAR